MANHIAGIRICSCKACYGGDTLHEGMIVTD